MVVGVDIQMKCGKMCVLALQTICADGNKTWHFNLIAH